MTFVANMNRRTTRTGVVICLFAILTLCFGQNSPFIEGINANLGDALQFLREYDHEAGNMCYQAKEAQWVFSTNLTEHNKQRMLEEQSLQSKLDRVSWRKAIGFSWSRMPDHLVRRQLRMLTSRTRSALSDSKLNELHNLIQEMKDVYTKSRVCPYNSRMSAYCDLSLQPELTRTLAHSRDYEEQLHVWKSWHDAVGPPLHNRYIRYVHLVNEAAQLNGFRDAGHQERAEYEDPGFAQQMSELWLTLSPLYKQLHAYVRRKLYDHYGQRRVRADGPIPAHILGNMWGQNWKNILDLVIPFPGKRRADVTSEMLRQGYTPTRIFQKAEEFFTSLGLKPMPVEFWHKSMLQRPSDRPVACTASAWDFCNRRDYRIKQCTEVTMDDLLTTHHEMTHIQYYLQYSDQPLLFRDGANPGFHEAVSEAVILSVMTPKHMHRIGLLSNITDDYEASINFLLEMALDKVAYLPFAYLVDQWRWSVFTEGVEGMNARWWSLRLHHQGVIPPVPRGEMDFDPAAKYHIISDQPYIRYFVALVLQFQLHEALCQAAGHIGTLHTCDIYRSREAGRLLSEIMSVGSSRPWPEVLKIATRGRTSRLDATPLLEYFGPLILWLRVQNRDERLVGWSNSSIYTALFEQQRSSSSTEVSNKFSLVLMLCVLNYFFRFYTN